MQLIVRKTSSYGQNKLRQAKFMNKLLKVSMILATVTISNAVFAAEAGPWNYKCSGNAEFTSTGDFGATNCSFNNQPLLVTNLEPGYAIPSQSNIMLCSGWQLYVNPGVNGYFSISLTERGEMTATASGTRGQNIPTVLQATQTYHGGNSGNCDGHGFCDTAPVGTVSFSCTLVSGD
jgi:hypothetical protein